MTEDKSEDLVSVVSSLPDDVEDLSDDDLEPHTILKKTHIVSVQESYSNYSNKKYTRPYINKYERAKLLGMRQNKSQRYATSCFNKR